MGNKKIGIQSDKKYSRSHSYMTYMLNYAGWGADKYIRGHGEKGTTRA
jgi:hypothetical protein